MKSTKHSRNALLLVFTSLTLACACLAQTIFLNIGRFPGDSREADIAGFEWNPDGWFWWDNQGTCGGPESNFQGKIGYRSGSLSLPKVVVADCLANPGKCSPARDEAYVYYFARQVDGGNFFLHRKALNTPQADPGVLFSADGTTIQFPETRPSRLWVDGDYLYFQSVRNSIGIGWNTRLRRVRRDGTSVPETFESILGQHFITEFEPFRYFQPGNPVGSYRTGHLILTEAGGLYARDANGAVTLSRSNVADLAILPPGGGSNVSTVYTVENTGGQGNAVGRLYLITPLTGTGFLRNTWPGYHLLEVELANWPDDTPGRVFVHRATVGISGYRNNTCRRQETKGSLVAWEQFIATNFEGRLKGSREWVFYVHDSKILGKKSDAPPELIDVDYLGMEVTQGVQSLGHHAIMVAGKPTYVRAYARLSTNTTPQPEWWASAILHGSRGGSPLPGSPLSPQGSTSLDATDTIPAQRNNDEGYLFPIPPSWTTGGPTTFELRLNESGVIPETGTDGNGAGEVVTVNFVRKERSCLRFRPLKTIAAPYDPFSPSSGFAGILERCEALTPVAGLDYEVTSSVLSKLVFFWEIEWLPCPFGVCPVPVLKVRHDPYRLHDASDNDGDWALFWLGVDRLLESDPCRDYHLVGTVHNDVPVFNGIGGVGDQNLQDLWEEFPDVAIPDSDWTKVLAVKMNPYAINAVLTPGEDAEPVWWNAPYGGRTLAHELGHNYGRRHINQNTTNCGGDAPEGPHDIPPFDTCFFGESSASDQPGAVAGFDVVEVEPIRNDLGTWGDLMSYSDVRWTSVWTWNAIANKIPNAAAAAAPPPPEGNAPGEWIVIKGFYDTQSGEAFLMPSEILPDGIIPAAKLERALTAELEMPAESPLEICQLDANGGTLCTHKAVPFALPREGDAPPGQIWFLQVVPCDPDMASVALCDEDALMAWLPRSPHYPSITVNTPVYDAANDLLHVSWDASDPDGSPLLFSVSYSSDDGATWRSLGSNLDTTELSVPACRLPGGTQVRVRVIACDIMDTAIGVTDPITVPGRAPVVRISSPVEGARVPFGELVIPRILAWDAEDGRLEPEWTLSGPSALSGVGESPSLRGLVPGDYLFTASASDSDGMAGIARRGFTVLPVEVPDGSAPVLDGYCADAGYGHAVLVEVRAGQGRATVRMIRSGNRLYVSLCDLPYAEFIGTSRAGIVIDTDGDAAPGQGPGADARGFYVDDAGIPSQTSGNGTTMVEESEPPLGFFAATQRGTEAWSAEFCIDLSLLDGWDHAARLFIDVRGRSAYRWPVAADLNEPATWAEAWLGALPAQPNRAPTALAAEQIVVVASEYPEITLDGAGEDPDGDQIAHLWGQVDGPPVTLQNSNDPQPSFVPPAVTVPTVLTFQLIVNDGALPSEPVETTVLLLPDAPLFVEDGVEGSPLVLLEALYLPDTNEVELRFAGQPGVSYDIERSVSGVDWNTVGTRTAGVTGRFRYIETVSPDVEAYLYRAAELP